LIRIVVTGSECTGKTTMAESLAAHYRTVWVPEYVRQYVDAIDRPLERRDVGAIARGQIETEDTHATRAGWLLVLDTDLLSTIVYSRHYYGDCPSWIEQAFIERVGDLYLLAGIDVPWVADGLQRDRGDRRQEMHELFRRSLVDHGLRFVELSGTRAERFEAAVGAVDRL
jgi:NadR type nicotinamide-nucleotide adenylyltransferase